MKEKDIVWIKAHLLSRATITLDNTLDSSLLQTSNGNLNKDNWIFIRLSNSTRVRLTVSTKADLILKQDSENNLYIFDQISQETIISNVTIERILSHAPEQLFFLLYKNCSNGCKFCPLTYHINSVEHYSWDKMEARIKENLPYGIKSIGITTACPKDKSQNDLVTEIIGIVNKIKEILGDNIPIGVSLKTPTRESLIRLKESGVCEMRLNLETYNTDIADDLMPNKRIDEILHSIKMAVEVFGKGKVSSNMIVGIGESDKDLLNGVRKLAEIGAVSTLYPYDPLGIPGEKFKRPSAERLYSLALKHKEILKEYNLDSARLATMCCSCAASHIYPEKDL